MKRIDRLLIVVLMLLMGAQTVSGWWNPGWTYRQEHTILGQNSDNANNSVLNEQIYLQVYNTSGSSSGDTIYIGNHAGLTNMTDIRIISTDDTIELYHWINATFDDHIDLWFRPQEIIKGQGNPVYIYYGNPDTNDNSDGFTTFPYYEHFDGTVFNNTQTTESGNAVVSNSILTLTGSATWTDYVQSVNTFDTNTSVEIRANRPSASYDLYTMQGYKDPAGGLWLVEGYNGGLRYRFYRSGLTIDLCPWVFDEFSTIEIQRNSTELVIMYVNKSENAFMTVDLSGTTVPISVMTYGNTKTHKVDSLILRKWLYPEPGHGAWGAEEIPATTPTPTPTPAPTPLPFPIEPDSGLYIGGEKVEPGIITSIYLTLDQQPFLLIAILLISYMLFFSRRQ